MFRTVVIWSAAFFILISPASAFELDWSVDDEIRQNYEPSKLEQEVLPGLPSILKESSNSQSVNTKTRQTTVTRFDAPPKTTIETEYSGRCKIKKDKKAAFTAIKIRRGTKFKVKSKTNVADWNTSGAGMTFVTTEPVTSRYVSVPAGTVFKGSIESSRQPNGFGNGGLLKLKADSVTLNGSLQNVNAKVIRANNKVIILNNIKGKRGYMRGIGKAVDKGEKFYNKSRTVSKKLAGNPVGVILSPVPAIVGAAGYIVNLAVSPVTALWSKGDHISIPAGTNYTIKLREDLYMY